jgi:hypothetical protein
MFSDGENEMESAFYSFAKNNDFPLNSWINKYRNIIEDI